MPRVKNIDIGIISAKDVNRFWGRVNLTANENSCWEWNKVTDTSGYGLFWVNHKYFKSHRISYFLSKKQNPKDFMVCHSCDNPKCVNPKHLFLGTNQDNMKDMIKKGRGRNYEYIKKFRKNNPDLITKGEKQHLSKLKDSQILDIRNTYKNGGVTSYTLADYYNVSATTIQKIISRKTWKHI